MRKPFWYTLGGFCIAALTLGTLARRASAHEAYVLTKTQFSEGLASTNTGALRALASPGNLRTFLEIAGAVLLLLVLNFLFRRSNAGQRLHAALERLQRFGPLLVRLAIAASFFFSALTWSFLGPELTLAPLPFSALLRGGLFAVSGMLFLGLFTEIAALASLVIYVIAALTYHWYLLTYLNYFGEIMALLFFGSREFSLDKFLFGPLRRFPRFASYEASIVRVCYGLALSYAAITIKFLHPLLTVTVVEEYHLTSFHWLFPHDPLLVTLGAALAELAIGLFIVFGFELRLTVLISLFYITLSLVYFGEVVWPHLMLYGISLNLLVQPEVFTLDRLFSRKRSSPVPS